MVVPLSVALFPRCGAETERLSFCKAILGPIMMKTAHFPKVMVLIVALFLIAPALARAALGQHASSIDDDAAKMNATVGANPANMASEASEQNAKASGNFTVQQITTPYGTVVSEYADQGGTIFAVTWRGSRPPDVATLLGAYFKEYSDAAKRGAPSLLGVHAASVQASDVTVESSGHMGFMWGRAYLPAKTPKGVSLSEIK
jgi:hypothetical protein